MKMSTKKLTTETFIERAKIVHNCRYDYSKVSYVNAHTKVCIICPEHGEFWQTPDSHLKGKGCPKCANEHRNDKRKLTQKTFEEKAREIHGNKYDYSKAEYVNYKTKVCVICPEHGEFFITPNNLLIGQGCPKCVGKSLTFNDFVQKVTKKYGDIYDFSYAENEFKNLSTKITVGYNGKYFKIQPRKILFGNCGRGPITMSRVYSQDDFIKKANEIHKEKYDYSKVDYVNSHTKVCIICPEHGEFWQTPNDHLNGCECPICSKERKRSKLEEETKNYLEKNNIEYIEQYSPSFLNEKFSHQKIDFFLPDYNIGIECQGQQHFGGTFFSSLSENIERDTKKHTNSLKNGLKIYYVIERHIKMKDILNNELYKTIYKEDNTAKKIDLLFKKMGISN